MQNVRFITIVSNRKEIVLSLSTILYVMMKNKIAEIHVAGGAIHETRITMKELENKLSDDFIKVYRGCVVSVMAIHDITDKIYLSNGETLQYTVRKKNAIIQQFRSKQKRIINSFQSDGIPLTNEEYDHHYHSFDYLPFAFTDIEMVFNEDSHAVDWIFRYGNQALAKLEKLSLEKLIGSSFGSIFSNMDEKWLKTYERATLYGETLEIMDYSPEIDTYLKVICFPTFKGHCGCILFDISNIKYIENSDDAKKTLMRYLGNTMKEDEQ